MDFEAAIAKVSALEGGEELASAIKSHVTGINTKLSDVETKVHTVIGEKRTATQQNASLKEAIKSMASAVGIDGEVADVLEKLPETVTTLSSTAKASAKAAAEWESKAKDFENKYSEATNAATFAKASAHGVNPDALKTALGDLPLDRLKFGDDGIAIKGEDGNDTPLRDFVEQSDRAWLAPALFGSTEKKSSGKTAPTGGGGGGESPANPLEQFKAKHKAPSFLRPKAS
jgi:hypothetical protein